MTSQHDIISKFKVTVGQNCLSDQNDVLRQFESVFENAGESELVILPEYAAHNDLLELDNVSYVTNDMDLNIVCEWLSVEKNMPFRRDDLYVPLVDKP